MYDSTSMRYLEEASSQRQKEEQAIWNLEEKGSGKLIVNEIFQYGEKLKRWTVVKVQNNVMYLRR